MRFIGVHFGHDSAVVIINEDGEVEFYAQCERYKRKKNHGGYDYNAEKPALSCLAEYFPDLGPLRDDDFCVLVAIGGEHATKEELWHSIGNISTESTKYDPFLIRSYAPKERENFIYWTLGRNPDMVINHHLAHIVSAWCFRPDDQERFFMAYDGVGLDAHGVPHSSLVGEIGPSGVRRFERAPVIPTSIPLTSLLGYNSAGKAMGLAGYVTNCRKWNGWEFVRKTVEFSMDPYTHTTQYPTIPNYSWQLTRENMDYVAHFYKWYTNDIIWPGIEDNITKFGMGRGVVIGGGTTLALELNTRIHGMVKDVVFGPPTDDSGLALGAAAWAFYHLNGWWPKLSSPSLHTLQTPLPRLGPQQPEQIASRLSNGQVIGLLRGKAEAGPRALGFRSILASAKNRKNLRRVSQQIKKREFYRPLAPIVTAEQFDRFFIGPRGKYMQYRVHCTEEAKELLPAIVHKDGTARPQVVNKQDDPWLHQLLVAYGEESGVECLINTSLNGKKRPICNTLEDAQKDMAGKDVELVSITGQRPMFI